MVVKVFLFRSTSEAIISQRGETTQLVSLSPSLFSILYDSLNRLVGKGAMSVWESFVDPSVLIYERRVFPWP